MLQQSYLLSPIICPVTILLSTVLKTIVPHHPHPLQPRTATPELRTAPLKPLEPRTLAHCTPSYQSRTEPPVYTPAPSGPLHHPAPPRTRRHTPRVRVYHPCRVPESRAAQNLARSLLLWPEATRKPQVTRDASHGLRSRREAPDSTRCVL